MGDQKRGDDAADHAPKPGAGAGVPKTDAPADKQEAPNYDDRNASGRSIAVEDINSANDE